MSKAPRLPASPDKLSQLALLLEQSASLVREIAQEHDQDWFWTEPWQAWENAAQADIQSDHVDEFTSAKDFLAAIRA